MKKLVWVISVLSILCGFTPSSLFAQSQSASFAVSVIVPQQIQLSSPTQLQEADLGGLLLPAPKYWVGEQTNLGKQVDASFVMREISGQTARIFTLTVL